LSENIEEGHTSSTHPTTIDHPPTRSDYLTDSGTVELILSFIR